MTTEVVDYDNILETISQWPLVSRLTLIQDVMKSLTSERGPENLGQGTLDQALGLLATDKAAPSDVDVKRWLSEQRLKKFG